MTQARIHFEISAPKPASHVFHVSMTIQTRQRRASLPAWIPGSYLLREFAKNLGPITARLPRLDSGSQAGSQHLGRARGEGYVDHGI